MMASATHYAEADALEKRYWEQIGMAVSLGVLVYYPNSGGRLKALGDLNDEIAAAQRARSGNPATRAQ